MYVEKPFAFTPGQVYESFIGEGAWYYDFINPSSYYWFVRTDQSRSLLPSSPRYVIKPWSNQVITSYEQNENLIYFANPDFPRTDPGEGIEELFGFVASYDPITNAPATYFGGHTMVPGGVGGGGGVSQFWYPITLYIGQDPLVAATQSGHFEALDDGEIREIRSRVALAPSGSGIDANLRRNGADWQALAIASGDFWQVLSGLTLTLNAGEYVNLILDSVGSSSPGSKFSCIAKFYPTIV